MTPEICIIAALAEENRVIGKDNGNGFPWGRIPADMRHFRDLTTPHPVIMGRKTWDSLDDRYKPLPERPNLVVTRQPGLVLPDSVGIFTSIDQALNEAGRLDTERVFVIGGGEIYAQTMIRAHRLFLTLIKGVYDGDTFFPDYSEFGNIVSEKPLEEKGKRFRFVELTR